MGEDMYGFRAMALMVGALAIGGALMTSATSGHFDRLQIRKPKPRSTAPAPAPAPTPEPTAPDPTNTLYTEASFVPTNFDINAELIPAWGTGGIPISAAPDPIGAFRFICNAGQLLSDDPIVYPGRPGASHLHQFFGNTGANADSTYSSLRQSGQSTCMSPLNRSAYWMPAMLDGKGNAVKPDYVSIYYKRRPISDPKCSLTSGDPQAEGNCIPLPNGLRFVFGYDMVSGTAPTGGGYFNCIGATATSGQYSTITAAMANCPTKPNPDGSYNRIGALIQAPACWDGKNLDSPNHRSHVSYASYGNWGYKRCPSTHPFVIPTFTMGAWYTVDENLGTWHLSSDEMMPGMRRARHFMPIGSEPGTITFRQCGPTIVSTSCSIVQAATLATASK